MAGAAPLLSPAKVAHHPSSVSPPLGTETAFRRHQDPNLTAMESFRVLSMALSKIPLVLRVAIMHLLNLSEPASYMTLRSEVIIAIVRSFLVVPGPWSISVAQKLSLREQVPKGRIWISTYSSPPPPETAVRDVLVKAIDDMRNQEAPSTRYRIPDLVAVEAEWTGYRAGAGLNEALPQMSEAEKYRQMSNECTAPTTILYLHGGAFYLCDPMTHRPTTKKLAKLTGGRCYSVRYRLAPQEPFPAALLDAFIAYLTLLYPPPDAFHEPVAPEHIVLAGDSAGGNLVFALTQLLLHLNRTGEKVVWYNEARGLPLPAAISGNSPWVDITQSSTKWEGDKSAPFDYLPPTGPIDWSTVPSCAIWPTTPARRRLYVDDDLVTHPLATLAMCQSWEHCPPVYICSGWEILSLEHRFLAKKLVEDGVEVVFEEYEAMPHTFAMVLTSTANAQRCYDGWAGFIRDAVENPGSITSSAVSIKAKSLEEVERKFEGLCDITEQQMQEGILAYAAPETTRSKL